MIFVMLASSVFFSAFFAATILPAQSEAVLSYAIITSPDSLLFWLWLAILGNVLGGCVNWCLGRYAARFQNRKWFPLSKSQMARAQAYYHRFGKAALLLSWVPVIGDPITVIAGLFREKFYIFLILVTLAKAGRYLVLALLVTGFFTE